jgi:hypothetical protein
MGLQMWRTDKKDKTRPDKKAPLAKPPKIQKKIYLETRGN